MTMNMQRIRVQLRHKWLLPLLFATSANVAMAQTSADTLTMTIPQAENTFLQKNLQLLAAQYNINAYQALIEQAKLWDNPILNTDQNIYDSEGGFFKHSDGLGTFYVQVQQLIKTAGKRSKLAQLATDNTVLAKAQFNDIMRTLRYTLITDLLKVNTLIKQIRVYDAEVESVGNLVHGMDAELNAGNISLKDFTRLKALLFGLQSEVSDVQSQLLPVQQEIKLLLQSGDSAFIKPDLSYRFNDLTTVNLPNQQSLIDTAKADRPDAAINQTLLDYNSHNLAYQKALAKPDVQLGLSYDQRSSYAPNYVGLQVGLPLPILNRNQGNIKSAQIQIQQQQAVLTQTSDRIANEVVAAVKKVKFYQQLNNKQQLDFSNQYDFLFGNMVKSFKDRQVNLLEFIDFIDDYKDTKLKLLDQHNNLVNAFAELNFTVNKTIVPIN
jgi:cobalt-zinc-cadmium efflux system outer membrane protein